MASMANRSRRSQLAPKDVLRSQLWQTLFISNLYEFQTTIFQPVGGMGRIGEAFGRKLDGLIEYNAKVTRIAQDDHGVTAHYEDAGHPGATEATACRLVHLHNSAFDPQPDSDERR